MPVSPEIVSAMQSATGGTLNDLSQVTPAAMQSSNSPYQQSYNASMGLPNPYAAPQGGNMVIPFLAALNQMRARQMAQYPEAGDEAYLKFNPKPAPGGAQQPIANNGVNPQPKPKPVPSATAAKKKSGLTDMQQAMIDAGLLVKAPTNTPGIGIYGQKIRQPIPGYWTEADYKGYMSDVWQSGRDGG